MASDNKNVPEIDPLEDCQKAIGYQFNQIDLLKSALTHASGVDSRLASNERLEFLGDSVLDCVLAEYLFKSNIISWVNEFHNLLPYF